MNIINNNEVLSNNTVEQDNNELLIELFTEDIPAKLQKKAIIDSKITFAKILDEYKAEYDNIETYISPRHLAVRVINLHNKTKSINTSKRGPKVSADSKIIECFLQANNKKLEELEVKDDYYFVNNTQEGCNIESILQNIIEKFIDTMPWPKSMHWSIENSNELSTFWIRPIRSIICIYNSKTIECNIKSVGITTSNYTYGHRFLSDNKIEVLNFEDYKNKLEKNNVIIDFYSKRSYIEREMTQKAAAMGLLVKNDETLLDEVTGLVEYPFVHIGNIDEKFMVLPMEVLSTSMKVHQKYFTLTYPDSTIAPFFITVTNVPETNVMHEGFERVLRARLSDAMFFYKEDTDVTLEAYAQRLSNIVFHEKLGTMSQKIDRLMSIANSTEEHRVISLCKADLVTQMVGEFPELQGIMGDIYAKAQGESIDISTPIREHYKPLGAKDSLPSTFTGSRVSFFDKLDTLVGFIGAGIKPTGSKDPFALRRAALSIIRLILDSNHDVLEDTELYWYIETLIESYAEQGIALSHNTIEEVSLFLIDRLAVYLSDKLNINADICWQVIESYEPLKLDYRIVKDKIIKLNEYYKNEKFEIVENAYKRVNGILDSEEIDNNIDILQINTDNEYMIKLKDKLIELQDKQLDISDFIDISKITLNVCENVLINDEDLNIKTNNLILLNKYSQLIKSELGSI